MRATFAIVSAIASTIASVSAGTLAARQVVDCNPSYDVPGSTACYTACNVAAGSTYVPGWTMDHTSPLFIASLSVMCDKTSPNYVPFMTAAGTCMIGCTGDDPTLFAEEFSGACAWWAIHKNDTC